MIDPIDELAIAEYRVLQHLAVVNCRLNEHTNLVKEYFYGNTDYVVPDFVTAVISILGKKFPNKSANLINNSIEEQYSKKDNNSEPLHRKDKQETTTQN